MAVLAPGQTTIQTVRLSVRQRADMVGSNFVTDSELDGYIAASQAELYDLLVQKYGDDYFAAAPFSIQTDGVKDLFALPSDFYKVLAVDLQIAAGPNGSINIPRFNRADRNLFSRFPVMIPFGISVVRYRLLGNNLWLRPMPPGGYTVILTYVPRLSPAADQAVFQLSGVSAGDAMTINGVAFTAVGSGATGNQFNVGASDLETAANLVTALNGTTSPGVASIVTGIANGAIITLTTTSTTLTWAVTGTTITGSPASPIGGIIDGVSGWEEYIVIDAAIKAMQKEESDVSVLMAQKQAMIARIESAAENRDADRPQTVADVQRGDHSGWPGMGGYGSW